MATDTMRAVRAYTRRTDPHTISAGELQQEQIAQRREEQQQRTTRKTLRHLHLIKD